MTTFHYIALNPQGKRVKGVLEGDSARIIRQQLRNKQLTPVEVYAIGNHSLFSRSRYKISSADLSLLFRQMATLMNAGIPVDEILTALSEQTEKQVIQRVLSAVRAKILEGYSLANAMSSFSHTFPAVYTTTISAGEKTGQLDHVLNQLAEYAEKQHGIRQKVLHALIYPMMMTGVSLTIIIFLLIYVVPRIVNVFDQTNQTLPLATIILIRISYFVSHNGIYLFAGFAALFFLFKRVMRMMEYRKKFHHMILTLPIIGRMTKAINCARFGRTFGILQGASVPVIDAMRSAVLLVKPIPMREKIESAILHVQEGSSIHFALQKTGYFSPMFIHLLSSGESSGQLSNMLEKASAMLENHVDAFMQTALKLFEPLLIIVMGSIVLYIVLAILLPIFSLDQMM